MRAPWSTVLRVCREVAYGINSTSAITHGKRPAVPPYPPPSVFAAPGLLPEASVVRRTPHAGGTEH